jgi:hypothetical protein
LLQGGVQPSDGKCLLLHFTSSSALDTRALTPQSIKVYTLIHILITGTGLDGDNPLHAASSAGHTAVMALLLKARVDPNAVAGGENSALHLACEQGHDTAVAVLLAGGAEPELRNQVDETPREVAQRLGYPVCVAVIDQFSQADPQVEQRSAPAAQASRQNARRVTNMPVEKLALAPAVLTENIVEVAMHAPLEPARQSTPQSRRKLPPTVSQASPAEPPEPEPDSAPAEARVETAAVGECSTLDTPQPPPVCSDCSLDIFIF